MVVEAHYGELRQQEDIDKLPVTGIEQMTNRVAKKIVGYNFKIISRLMKNEPGNKDDLKIFVNQLKREFPDLKFFVTVT